MEETPCSRAREAYWARSDEYWRRSREDAPYTELQRIWQSVLAANDAQYRYCGWADGEGPVRMEMDLLRRQLDAVSLEDLEKLFG